MDKRLERAVQILGATSRFEAARILFGSEQATVSSPGASDLSDVDARAVPERSGPAGDWEHLLETSNGGQESTIKEPPPTSERITSDAFDIPDGVENAAVSGRDEPRGLVSGPIYAEVGPVPKRARNRLGRWTRLAIIAGLMLLIALSGLAMLSMAETLQMLFRPAS